MQPLIALRVTSGPQEGQAWRLDGLVRIGRLENLDVFLDDPSISRRHAEVVASDQGWVARDLGSTNGTFLNGVRIGRADRKLQRNDVLQCGSVTMLVVELHDPGALPNGHSTRYEIQAVAPGASPNGLDEATSLATAQVSAGERLLPLLRAGRHLCHIHSLPELLQAILEDAVVALSAQRGAIVLLEEATGQLQLRCAAGPKRAQGGARFSRTLAQRSLAQSESLLCRSVASQPDLQGMKSIQVGAMASVLCVLLRTPRKRLGVLHLDRGPLQPQFERGDLDLADALAASVSAGIESAQLLEKQKVLVEEQRNLFIQTVTALAHAVDLRDRQTGSNSQRVTDYAVMLAEELKLSAMDRYHIQLGTPLRDIGKIGIPEAVLQKPAELTTEEFEQVKMHPAKGVSLLSTIPDLQPVLPIVRHHHESWDGSGYPDGLAGERIPRLARIVALADAFDALISQRPYRKPVTPDKAFADVWDRAGVQFDPECVQAFLRLRPRVEEALRTGSAQTLETSGREAYATLR